MSTGIWAHYNPVKIHFGRGCRASVQAFLAGRNCLIVCSPRGRQRLELDALLGQAISCAKSIVWIDAVEPNPDIKLLKDITEDLKNNQLDCVVAFGGGSAIDSAKVFSLALSHVASHLSLRELIVAATSLPIGVALPLYVLPTTAGTGSEVTPYATVWDHAERRKLSLSGPALYPNTAFVDPELTDSVPYNSTLNTGLDALNQAAESIWNRGMTPMSEMLANRALKIGLVALPELLTDLYNKNLRDAMSEVSLLAGLAISQTRTSLCHSISYPLTAHYGVPHGLACAFTMPAVLRHNLKADDGRFARLANILSLPRTEGLEGLPQLFDSLNQQLCVVEQVRAMVGSLDALMDLCDQMFTPGRIDNNLIDIDNDSLIFILNQSWMNTFREG